MGKSRKKTVKPDYDWEAIKVQYRLGTKSLRVLSSEFGPSHGQIGKNGSRSYVESEKPIVIGHRQSIVKLKELEDELVAELRDNPTKLWIGQHQGEIVKEEVGIAVTERASAYQRLVSAMSTRIERERQAFGLDDTKENGDGLHTVVIHDPTAT